MRSLKYFCCQHIHIQIQTYTCTHTHTVFLKYFVAFYKVIEFIWIFSGCSIMSWNHDVCTFGMQLSYYSWKDSAPSFLGNQSLLTKRGPSPETTHLWNDLTWIFGKWLWGKEFSHDHGLFPAFVTKSRNLTFSSFLIDVTWIWCKSDLN